MGIFVFFLYVDYFWVIFIEFGFDSEEDEEEKCCLLKFLV